MVASALPASKTLSHKQECFARLVAEGKTYTEAYRIAYQPNTTANTVRVNAYRLAIQPEVEAKIAEFKTRLEERMFLTRSRKRHILYEIAEQKRNKPTERIRAIEVDNAMSGDLSPVKIEGDITLLSALGQLKQAEPVIELETRIELSAPPVHQLEERHLTPEQAFKAVSSAPPVETAIPFDSSPFGEQAPDFTPASDETPVKLTRTRSYDE